MHGLLLPLVVTKGSGLDSHCGYWQLQVRLVEGSMSASATDCSIKYF